MLCIGGPRRMCRTRRPLQAVPPPHLMVAHVRRQRDASAALCLHQCGRVRCVRVLVQVGDHHVGPWRCRPCRRGGGGRAGGRACMQRGAGDGRRFIRGCHKQHPLTRHACTTLDSMRGGAARASYAALPSRAKCTATARPMPESPPVTSATLPCSNHAAGNRWQLIARGTAQTCCQGR